MAEGCAACHAIAGVSVGGAGSTAGPALDGIGARHDLRWLAAMLPGHLRQEWRAVPALSTQEQRDLLSYLATLR
jgi:mono/diheme cytochrome c family protein